MAKSRENPPTISSSSQDDSAVDEEPHESSSTTIQKVRKKKKATKEIISHNGSLMELKWSSCSLRRIKINNFSPQPFIVLSSGNSSSPSSSPVSLRGFNIYRFDQDDGLRAHGGVAVLIRDSLFSEEHNVRTDLQTVCVRVHLPSFSFTVCSIYIPPGQVVSQRNSKMFFLSCPPPFLLRGILMPTIPSGVARGPAREVLSSKILLTSKT